ncbi:MAG: DUF3791 domain-containing protein [Treponema sp.]|nr:DUF3791 domain-containing protein [Treponema sp.]
MDKRNADVVYFISFCIENYKNHCGKSGADVLALFDSCGATEYLEKNYDVLHTQSAQWLIEELDEYIGIEHACVSRKS